MSLRHTKGPTMAYARTQDIATIWEKYRYVAAGLIDPAAAGR